MFNCGWAVLKAYWPLFFLGLDGTFIIIIVIIIILEGHARKSMAFVYGQGIGIGIFFFCCRRYGRDEVVLGVRC
jgi:hypothetical protein